MPARTDNGIKLFQIELTNHCDLMCTFCPHSEMKRLRGFMARDLAERLLAEAADSGLSHQVGLSYFGESLLHPDLQPILHRAGTLGLEPWLCTSGTRLDREMRQRLLDSPLVKLEISLQTPSEETFALRQAGGDMTFGRYFGRVEAMVRDKYRFGRDDLDIEIKLLYTGDSPFKGQRVIDSLDEICRHARHWRQIALDAGADLGSGEADFRRRLKRFPGLYRPGDYDAPANRIEAAPGLIIFCCPFIYWGTWIYERQLEMSVSPCENPSCHELDEHLIVLWDGRVTCCCVDYEGELAYADASARPLGEIWRERHTLFTGESDGAAPGAPEKCQACRGRIQLDMAALRAMDPAAVTRMACTPRGLSNFTRRALRKLRS